MRIAPQQVAQNISSVLISLRARASRPQSIDDERAGETPALPAMQFRTLPGVGTGVIWSRIPIEEMVIPAKAGIQSLLSEMASRLRGNDCAAELRSEEHT